MNRLEKTITILVGTGLVIGGNSLIVSGIKNDQEERRRQGLPPRDGDYYVAYWRWPIPGPSPPSVPPTSK